MYFEPFCLPPGMAPGPEYRDAYEGATGSVGSRRGEARRKEARWRQHHRAASVLRLAGPWTFFRYFKFTTIRDPFTRTLSAFRYSLRQRQDPVEHTDFEAERAAFNTWLEKHYVWIQDRRMYLIAGIPVANFFIRYEHLHADVERVCTRLNLPFERDRLPHKKKMPAPTREPRAYYTPENARRLARTHAWEMRRFGYGAAPGATLPAS